MKKLLSPFIFLVVLVLFTSLGCQAILPASATATIASTPKKVPSTPTATENLPTATYTPPVPTSPAPPTEGWIAFLNKNNIWLIHPDGSGLTQVTKNKGDNPRIENFKWSPNGKILAYSLGSSNRNTLMLYDIQTSTNKMLINSSFGGDFDWSPTSKQIIYDTPSSGDNPSPSQLHNTGLWVINLDNSKKRQVVKPPSNSPSIITPQWSSEGSHVLFATPCFEPNCIGTGVADYKTGKSIMLPVNGWVCKWAPSELQIACIQRTPDHSELQGIVIFDQNGNVLKKFSLETQATSSYYSDEVWSPDGKMLAIEYFPDAKAQIKLLNLETGQFDILAPGALLDWSPNGNWILSWDDISFFNTPRHISILNVSSKTSYSLSEFDGSIAGWQPYKGTQ